MTKVEDLVWTEHPVFKGAQTVILVGDPTKAETIVQRTKFPTNYRVPPHTHPYAEVVTVLSGNYWNSFGRALIKVKGGAASWECVRASGWARALYMNGRYGGYCPGDFYWPGGRDLH